MLLLHIFIFQNVSSIHEETRRRTENFCKGKIIFANRYKKYSKNKSFKKANKGLFFPLRWKMTPIWDHSSVEFIKYIIGNGSIIMIIVYGFNQINRIFIYYISFQFIQYFVVNIGIKFTGEQSERTCNLWIKEICPHDSLTSYEVSEAQPAVVVVVAAEQPGRLYFVYFASVPKNENYFIYLCRRININNSM
jgi:hypothetical protein